MNTEKILLEFNEKGYNDLINNQKNANSAINALVGYCEETLEIEVKNLRNFFSNPKQYCINAYWEKYGAQFGNAPVKKEKAFKLTRWNDSSFEPLCKKTRIAFDQLAAHQYKVNDKEVLFENDPEAFKKYLAEEDREIYDLSLQFIDLANKMQERGGKVAWYLARYYPTLAVDGEKLIPSKMYFTSNDKTRNLSIGSFLN